MLDLEPETAESYAKPGRSAKAKEVLEIYWRDRFDALASETTAQTIRSLRSQIDTCKRLAREALAIRPARDGSVGTRGGDATGMAEALKSIDFHCGVALALKPKHTDRDDERGERREK